MPGPMIIKLVRHGESESNTGEVNAAKIGDQNVKLTKKGEQQAFAAGQLIGADFINSALRYRSPFRRTRQTMHELLRGADLDPEQVNVFEDPRLREIDTGYGDYEKQQKKRRKLGWFYYRYKGGESFADCFDRTCTFVGSLSRQAERKRIYQAVIAAHGGEIRCFVMCFLHLTVEQFEAMENPRNGDVITITLKANLQNPVFTKGKWGVEGIRLRKQPRTIESEKESAKAKKAEQKAARAAAKADRKAAKAVNKDDKEAAFAAAKADRKAAEKAAKAKAKSDRKAAKAAAKADRKAAKTAAKSAKKAANAEKNAK
jgi:broad specificity phosphatase PhoE